jgi:hypothetical protein
MKKLTTKEFINKSNIIHNNFYDYSKVEYKNSHIKVEIVCPKHGSFFQRPYDHLNRKSCGKCANNFLKTKKEFIELATTVHGNRYIYSKVDYRGNKNKVEIICTIHGSFLQKPNNHLNGSGCLKCSGLEKKSYLSFKESASKIHNNFYDYSKVIYNNSTIKVEIICPIHGSFFQSPRHHLYNKSGCSKCRNFSSKIENEWLHSIRLPNNRENRQVFIKINNKKFRVDGYDPDTKTIYEFLGDFWHGNINILEKNEMNPILKKTYFDLYCDWLNRKKIFEENGYNVVFIWENDFRTKRKGLNT